MTILRYMLDTDTVSDLFRNPFGRVAARLARVGDGGLGVSIVVAAELRYGYLKKGSSNLLRRVEAVLTALDVLPFDTPSYEHDADIRNALRRAGTPIGPNDLLIAAHARALALPLVTGNMSEYERVPGLNIENWLI